MELGTTAALVAAIAVALLAGIYSFFSLRYSFWRKRGVPYLKPVPLLGSLNQIRSKGIKGLTDAMEPFRSEGHCGYFVLWVPFLAVWDLEMVKQILCKDFSSFHDRGVPFDEADPLSAHLFNLEGAKWRNLRNRLSPTFTSGKMKAMLPLMLEVADELGGVLAKAAAKSKGGEVDVEKILHRFSTDVIGSCAFGVRCNCLSDENNSFLAMSRNLLKQTVGLFIRLVLGFVSPRLTALIPMKFLYPKENLFFLTLMRETVEYREKNKVERNDFVNLMMQLRDSGRGQEDPENHVELTSNMMAAQGAVFFGAGLDNVSNTLGYCLNRLAVDPALQSRVGSEVDEILRRHNGELSYEAIKDMDLVNRVILEGLRLWNPIGFLFRRCNATTQVGNLVVEKGTTVVVPAVMIHMDPDVFPEPSRFDPDRHTAEAQAGRHPYAFLPFGEGPRVCIASRFALMELRLALAVLLRDFEFRPGPKFEHEIELDMSHQLPTPKNGIPICVIARKHVDSSED